MRLKLRDGVLALDAPVVMGILNLTPDSFSDGGRYPDLGLALARAREMVAQGAGIIDVGGESTRPGAQAVPEEEEIRRVVPLIRALRQECAVPISIDTMKPAVMRAACEAGAQLVNDVMALRAPGALAVVRETGAAVCLMHMQGEPRTMQQAPQYQDVRREVCDFLAARVQACRDAGIEAGRICLDPGVGFGKLLPHNLALLADLQPLRALGHPLLIGVSRKSMFGELLGRPAEQRLAGSLAAAAVAVWQGAAIVRAHDVRETVDTVRVVQALAQARASFEP
ncbi:dihydropteroate synthase [Solimonas aquatica]|uniref:Dihydropteroate synthase n=1 Tax=Solimonas aquatica TaxID=489703 RepID=A0A1H9I3F6_9GAMM|nr:dihydropteroate synthase [Solimonas aquatica]SEQ69067.1 dihydropteroate synthase [Solimonas aquatica]